MGGAWRNKIPKDRLAPVTAMVTTRELVSCPKFVHFGERLRLPAAHPVRAQLREPLRVVVEARALRIAERLAGRPFGDWRPQVLVVVPRVAHLCMCIGIGFLEASAVRSAERVVGLREIVRGCLGR